ncbi:MAG: LPXTG cell wall anchor domain-containing protein [Eubacteriales bacterium]|nr:LPXTG cell wall anchor domain-containing protein [Eubacteriales bacterium]
MQRKSMKYSKALVLILVLAMSLFMIPQTVFAQVGGGNNQPSSNNGGSNNDGSWNNGGQNNVGGPSDSDDQGEDDQNGPGDSNGQGEDDRNGPGDSNGQGEDDHEGDCDDGDDHEGDCDDGDDHEGDCDDGDEHEGDCDDDEAAISLEKNGLFTNVVGNEYAQAGDKIVYEFVIENTGDTDLKNISLVDEISGVLVDTLGTTSLNENADPIRVHGEYELTSEDISRGYFTNTAYVTADCDEDSFQIFEIRCFDPCESVRDDAESIVRFVVDPFVPAPGIQIVKSSTTTEVSTVGQVVPYTFTVTNIGNVILTSIDLVDDDLDAEATLTASDATMDNELDPNEVWVFTGIRTITIDELESNGGGDGDIDNTAIVYGTPYEDEPISAQSSIAIAINYDDNDDDDGDGDDDGGDTTTIKPLAQSTLVVEGATMPEATLMVAGAEMPSTGESTNDTFTVFGFMTLLITGVALMLMNRKNKQQVEK